jgi:AcrR family transcriptional regulator
MDRPEAQPDRRAERRLARQLQSRTDILDAAEKVFGEYGIHDGSVRKIAVEAGFSAAAIYLFFDSKQHLLAETLTRRSDELIGVVRQAAESESSPLDKLHQFVEVAIVYFGERPNFQLLLRHLRGGPTATWPILAEFAEKVHGRYLEAMLALAEIVREGQAVGQIREGNEYAIAHLYSVLITEYLLLQTGPDESTIGTLTAGEFHGLIDGMLRQGDSGWTGPAVVD